MPDATTPETRITPAMVNAAWSKGKDLRMSGLPTDFREVLEAAMAATPSSPNPVADNPAGDQSRVKALEWLQPAPGKDWWTAASPMGPWEAKSEDGKRYCEQEYERRVLACLEPGQGWRDIASAPKDGSEILLTDGQTVGSGFWSDAQEAKRAEAGWFWESDRDNLIIAKNAHGVTHWSPMPPPPAAEGSR